MTHEDLLHGFDAPTLTFEEVPRTVFRRLVRREDGALAPAVVVMHEIPGITPPVAAFAVRLAEEGFSVYLPHLFGEVGRPLSAAYALGQMARACISREFSMFEAGRSSPITSWLRALCRHASAESGGRPVGALGMCLTGNFALSLVVDDVVAAPVLSQPSLPVPLGPDHRADLHVSDDELARLRARARGGLRVLGLRFTEDPLCPGERFRRLERELGDGFEPIEIDSRPGNPHGIPRIAHSVLTNDLVDRAGHPTRAALDRVLSFFRERLG